MGLVKEASSIFPQTYPYNKGIVAPEGSIANGGLGMSSEGSLKALADNVAGLVSYGQLLISGGGKANKNVHEKYGNTQRPLGDRVFVKTPAECKPVEFKVDSTADVNKDYLNDLKSVDPENDYAVVEEHLRRDRYVFIDHIPTGYIPGLGNAPTFRGLIPAVVGNIFQINPLGVVKAISQPAYPPCVNLEIETIEFDESAGGDWTTGQTKHKIGKKDHFVNVQDILDMNGCSFKKAKINGQSVPDNANPITGNKSDCGEGFQTLFKEFNKTTEKLPTINIKNKPIAKIFTTSFGLLLAYLLFKILRKEVKI